MVTGVEIEFDEYQARWLRERSPFHAIEQREELRDGRLRLRLTVTRPRDLPEGQLIRELRPAAAAVWKTR